MVVEVIAQEQLDLKPDTSKFVEVFSQEVPMNSRLLQLAK
jgi:hypothetical protein